MHRALAAVARAPARSFHAATASHAVGINKYFKHRDAEENNANIPFDFTKENWEKAQKILTKYPPRYKRAATIPLLDLAQRQNGGWVPLAAMNKIATILSIPPMYVYETCSFYSMFNRVPIGKYFVQVCGTTPCEIHGFHDIMKACQDELDLRNGHTDKERLFTLLEVECLGACVHAPMMQINDDYYEDLTPETTRQVLQALRRGEKPKVGSQKGRIVAEPFGPRTSLTEKPLGNYAPFLEQLDKEAKAGGKVENVAAKI